eukprot:5470249-Ditylum_brightwellii.AAC.1
MEMVLTIVLTVERIKQNKCVDDDKDDSVDNSVDGGDKQFIHKKQAKQERIKQNKCVDDDKDDSDTIVLTVERSKQNKCADDGKEGVDYDDDDSVDGGDKHLTHLTQVENNVNIGGCDKHLTH